MGYWGFEPKDGDGPLDYFHEYVDTPVRKGLAKLYKKKRPDAYERWERVGFVQLLWESHINIPLTFMDMAIADLRACVLDPEFSADWKDPEQFVGEAHRLMQEWEAAVEEEDARIPGATPQQRAQMMWVQLEPCRYRRGLFDALDEDED
jgi:hypothetical protein